MENFDIETVITFMASMTNILWIYFHCLLGKLVTDRFEQLPNHLFHSKWYELPNKLQKYFILLLANTQEPLFFDGLGIYALNLETFTSVSLELKMEVDGKDIFY